MRHRDEALVQDGEPAHSESKTPIAGSPSGDCRSGLERFEASRRDLRLRGALDRGVVRLTICLPDPPALGSGHEHTDPSRHLQLGRRIALEYWYSPGTKADERLPYYAKYFDTVEVDSTYYSLPVEEMVSRWRANPGRLRHAREGVCGTTRHPVKVEQLPPTCVTRRRSTSAARRPSPAGVPSRGARRFHDALERLRAEREARRHPLPAPAVHRVQAELARVPRSGRRSSSPATVRWSSSGTPSWLDDEHRERRWASCTGRSGRRMSSSTRRASKVQGTSSDGARAHVADALRPLPRAERRDVEQARRRRAGALRPPLLER